MTNIRWKDNSKLVALAGTERLPATSIAGGPKEGGGSVPAEGDAYTTPEQLRIYSGTPKITSNVVAGVLTPDADTDLARPAALSAALNVANPTGAAINGWGMVVELIDNGTTRALTWGAAFVSKLGTLPSTTTAGKLLRVGVEYNSVAAEWRCMWVQEEV